MLTYIHDDEGVTCKVTEANILFHHALTQPLGINASHFLIHCLCWKLFQCTFTIKKKVSIKMHVKNTKLATADHCSVLPKLFCWLCKI